MAETLFVWKDHALQLEELKIFGPFSKRNPMDTQPKPPDDAPDLGLGFIEVHMTRLSHGMPDENDLLES